MVNLIYFGSTGTGEVVNYLLPNNTYTVSFIIDQQQYSKISYPNQWFTLY